MSAQPATADIIELDTSRIYQPPPKPVAANPILEAEPEAYQPPPNAVLNRPEPKKRQRKAKGTGKKPGRPPRAKTTTSEIAGHVPADPQPLVATPPHGSARPNIRFSRPNVDTLILILGGFVLFVAGGASAYFLTGVGQ